MKLILAGDMLFSSRNLVNRLDPTLVKKLQAADAVFANAEFSTPKPDKAVAAGRGYVTAVRPDTLKEFADLNIKLISLANNHSGDFGIEGMRDSLAAAAAQGLTVGGLANSLDEARMPSFSDTSSGRVGFVTATATRADVFMASNAGNGVPARPGVNPLRWRETYEVSPEQYEQLEKISDDLGLTASNEQGRNIEGFEKPDANTLIFGSLFEKNLTFHKKEKTQFKTEVNATDLDALTDSIRDAKFRSDFVFLNIHSHEGINANWYDDAPADFFVETAHAAIDAGADVVIGHGAHFMRGVETYHGKPIFYNLGSLMMEFESGNSIIPPEMYAEYGLDEHAKPSQLHRQRAMDDNGNFIGFNADSKFSQNIILEVDVDETHDAKIHVIPVDLGLTDENPVKRGLPSIPDAESAALLLERLNKVSRPLHTQFSYDEATNTFVID